MPVRSAPPSWLDDEHGIHPPSTPSAITVPSTPPSESGRKALEEAGLGFICEPTAKINTMLTPTPPVTPPAHERKVGRPDDIIVDVNVAPVNKGGSTNAPVHFIKRMQMAEAMKAERAADRAASSGSNGASVIPCPPKGARKPAATKSSADAKASPKKPSNKSTSQSGVIGVFEVVDEACDITVVPEINAETRTRLAHLISLFGENFVAKLVSPKFQHRQAAQQESLIMEVACDCNEALAKARLEVVQIGLRDATVLIATAAATALRTLLDDTRYETIVTAGTTIESALGGIANELIRRLKESNHKCHEACVAALNQISRFAPSSSPVSSRTAIATDGALMLYRATTALSETGPEKEGGQVDGGAKGLGARLEWCMTLVQNHKALLKSDWKSAMAFAASCLNSANNKIRKNAITLVTYIHRYAGKGIESFLEGVSAATVKLLMQELGEAGPSTVEEMLRPSVVGLDQVERKQEDDDIAAFEAENCKLVPEALVLLDLWEQTIKIRSLKCLFSSQWKMRERVLERLLHAIALDSLDDPHAVSLSNLTAVACVTQILEEALSDNVPPVVTAGFRCLQEALVQTTPRVLCDLSLPLIPLLVRKHGVPQCRDHVCELASQIFCCVSGPTDHDALFRSIIGEDINQPSATQPLSAAEIQRIPAKILQSRLELLLDLLSEIRELDLTSTDPTVARPTLKKFMDVARAYIDAPHPKVRAAVCNLVVELHHRGGSSVEPYLAGLTGPAIEELRSRLVNAAKTQKNGKAQRLYNIMLPLGEVGKAAADADAAAGGVKDRIMAFQKKKQEEAAETADPEVAKRNAAEMERLTGTNTVSSARTTPGKKSRLMFA